MKLRRGFPLALFVLLLIAVPILEISLLVAVGGRIGVGPTVAVLILEAVLGGWLMRHEGSRAWRALVDAFATGRVPSGELADAALILVGGVLLMLPGFVTDVVGLVFLIPWTRPFARKVIAFFVARRLNRLQLAAGFSRANGTADGMVVPGEVVDDPADQPGPADSAPRIIRGEIEEPPNRS